MNAGEPLFLVVLAIVAGSVAGLIRGMRHPQTRTTKTRAAAELLSIFVITGLIALVVLKLQTIAIFDVSSRLWGSPFREQQFNYAATAAAPPERLGVFGAWTATRTARVEGRRFNCQADTGPLDPPQPGESTWARARLTVYIWPETRPGASLIFWVRRTLPPGAAESMLTVDGQQIPFRPQLGMSPVRTLENSYEILNSLWHLAEINKEAIVTVSAPPAPGADLVDERFSLNGFREAVDAAVRACSGPADREDQLVSDAGLVRFGTGWNVHALPTQAPGRRICFAAARRLVVSSRRTGLQPEAAGPRIFVARDGSLTGGALLGFDAGRMLRPDDAVELQIGERRFALDLRAGLAEALDADAVIAAMLDVPATATLQITSGAPDGRRSTDSFSLDGFRWAYDALPTYCDR